MQIIRAKDTDVELLRHLAIQTFKEAFAEGNSETEMTLYLEKSFSREQLLKELNSASSEFYMVYLEDIPLAYLKVNFGNAQTESIDADALEIERIYVLKTYYGKSVAQLLLNKSITIARQNQKTFIWLGVWENNHRAVAFYKKNGFEVFGEHVFQFGNEPQTDLLMRLNIALL